MEEIEVIIEGVYYSTEKKEYISYTREDKVHLGKNDLAMSDFLNTESFEDEIKFGMEIKV